MRNTIEETKRDAFYGNNLADIKNREIKIESNYFIFMNSYSPIQPNLLYVGFELNEVIVIFEMIYDFQLKKKDYARISAKIWKINQNQSKNIIYHKNIFVIFILALFKTLRF